MFFNSIYVVDEGKGGEKGPTYWLPLGRRTKSGDLIVLPELLGHFVMGLPNTSYYHPITFTGTAS